MKQGKDVTSQRLRCAKTQRALELVLPHCVRPVLVTLEAPGSVPAGCPVSHLLCCKDALNGSNTVVTPRRQQWGRYDANRNLSEDAKSLSLRLRTHTLPASHLVTGSKGFCCRTNSEQAAQAVCSAVRDGCQAETPWCGFDSGATGHSHTKGRIHPQEQGEVKAHRLAPRWETRPLGPTS